MTKAHDPINREFTAGDLEPLLEEARVSNTVLVQTWSSLEETEAFLTLAGTCEFIAGVVGWVDLTGDVSMQLARLNAHPEVSLLKGIRHQVHDEDDANWLMRPDVQHGLHALSKSGLVYDLLIRAREIPAAVSCVKALPDMKFIVDHIAKPRICDGWDAEWDAQITQLATQKTNVWIKLSGLVTESNWQAWRPQDIEPYVQRVLTLFGTKRVMVGSDWPVCTLASTYGNTMELVRDCISNFSVDEQEDILRNNAIRAYGLDVA
ncbi:amidohydrolase family protein [Falsihalocynthiibacter arcticus]|nr:amidohydrolase family protein [Falsihalocynthiibacter arcticus]